MWAIRKASFRINPQPFSSVLLRARYAKVERASSSYTNTGFGVPPSNLSDRFGLLKRLSWDKGTQRLSMGIHTISSHANLQNVENASDYELLFEAEMFESENELDLLDTAEGVGRDSNSNAGTRDSSDLFKVLANSPLDSVQKALSKWIEEGRDLSSSDISHLISELRRRRMYGEALKLSEWLVSDVECGERDYASCLDLVFKIEGIHKAEAYLEKIPCSFAGELVYGTLLANCVSRTLITKAEDLYHGMTANRPRHLLLIKCSFCTREPTAGRK